MSKSLTIIFDQDRGTSCPNNMAPNRSRRHRTPPSASPPNKKRKRIAPTLISTTTSAGNALSASSPFPQLPQPTLDHPTTDPSRTDNTSIVDSTIPQAPSSTTTTTHAHTRPRALSDPLQPINNTATNILHPTTLKALNARLSHYDLCLTDTRSARTNASSPSSTTANGGKNNIGGRSFVPGLQTIRGFEEYALQGARGGMRKTGVFGGLALGAEGDLWGRIGGGGAGAGGEEDEGEDKDEEMGEESRDADDEEGSDGLENVDAEMVDGVTEVDGEDGGYEKMVED